MEIIDFNKDWSYRKLGDSDLQRIDLPHDAMILEKRDISSRGGVNSGWILANDYEYIKVFQLNETLKGKILTIEFESVYHNAEVYLNDELLMYRPYGYTNFYVDITNKYIWGKDNIIRVIARNADQPNSRWYSGTGIYRPVHLLVQDKKHILINGIKIHTKSINPAIIEVKITTNDQGNLTLKVFDDKNCLVNEENHFINESKTINMEIENAKLWDVEHPNLYRLEAKFEDDIVSEEVGIRTIDFSSENGFLLNGKRTLILGACIHHDNGILGAKDYKEASYRKIKLLKEYGYNAIRSAHNPLSKSMLDACSHLGMMVMDEYVDMWYIHKTKYDYANYVLDWYKQDIKDMCDKDYNHPCVIMFSLGNEVAETGQKKGIEFFKLMKEECKKYDSEKPVTTGVNIFFNYLHSIGLGFYTDEKAEKNPQAKVGSAFFNDLTGKFGAGFMKTMAQLPGCDRKTRDCYKEMDVAGYNYGINRYIHDSKKYPNRIILGSETFCSDAYAFFEFAKTMPSLIGDFVWAGMDYLGEVGVGSWEYKEYAKNFNWGPGWVSAGSGRIDLIGNPLGEALYTKVAFDKEDKPQIAVVPVSHTGEKHSPSAWKFSNAIPSWSWNGLDGKKAFVEVYSKAEYIELYINDQLVGKKRFKKNCRFDFNVIYKTGTITAVAYDKNHHEIGRNTLVSAKNDTIISLSPESLSVSKDELVFVNVAYTDQDGIFKPLIKGKITLDIENGELLAFGHACPFNEDGYNSNTSDVYYGRALAVIKANGNGDIKINATNGEISSFQTIKLQ